MKVKWTTADGQLKCVLKWGHVWVLKKVGSYHKISIGYVMFDQPSSQDDHSRLLGENGPTVQPANVWNEIKTPFVTRPTKTAVVISFRIRDVAHTFYNVQNQAGVLIWVEVDHVAEGAICQSGTEHWDVILKKKGMWCHSEQLIYP